MIDDEVYVEVATKIVVLFVKLKSLLHDKGIIIKVLLNLIQEKQR